MGHGIEEASTHCPSPRSSQHVTIVRERHPFEGRRLPVIRRYRRDRVLHCSSSFLMAVGRWFRRVGPIGRAGKVQRELAQNAADSLHDLAALPDLLQARTVVDALLARPRTKSPTSKESCHAVESGVPKLYPINYNLPHPRRPLWVNPWENWNRRSKRTRLQILTRLIAAMLATAPKRRAA